MDVFWDTVYMTHRPTPSYSQRCCGHRVCVTLSGDPESTLFRLTVNRITTEDAANAYDIATTTYMYGQRNAGMKHTERMISQLRSQAWDRGLNPQNVA